MNREVYPNSAYPLQGDVQSDAGNANVRVIGLNGAPFDLSVLEDGVVFQYDLTTNTWIARNLFNDSIRINDVTISDDYIVSVNVDKELLVNGA